MKEEKTMVDKKIKKRLCLGLTWLFPILFLIDDILGFNGYQFTIAGKSIRIILFCISMVVLCAYSLHVCYVDRISILPGKKGKVWLFRTFSFIDYLIALFIIGNMLWATVIPMVARGNMQYSIKDFSTVLVMTLYFPVMFLIKRGRLKSSLMEKLIYALCIVLAFWHCAMYIGERMSPGFYASYYDFIDTISFGTAVRSDVIFGFGIIRVVQTTSLFLLVGVFWAIRYCLKGRYIHLSVLLLFIFAICVTYTKSIWFGFILGAVVYLIFTVLYANKMWKRCMIVAVATIVMITSLNYIVFDNTIFSRVINTKRTQADIEQLQDEMEAMFQMDEEFQMETTDSVSSMEAVEDAPFVEDDLFQSTQEDLNKIQNEIWDAKGTQQANELRTQQTSALLNKWTERRWFGFGYGSYTEACIRNEAFPFMYESTLPALLMKIGVVGIFIWLVFIIGATIHACMFFWKRERSDVFWWLGLALSYALAVQTNPFLFTFAGFSILLYLMIVAQTEFGVVRINGCNSNVNV